tara:strand:+ start:75 stop:869 length:795 start_codon:yes stop_codon:yes gene_type:complete
MNFTQDKSLQDELRATVIEEVSVQLNNIKNRKNLKRPSEVIIAERILLSDQKQNRRPNDYGATGADHFSISVTNKTNKEAIEFMTFFVFIAKQRGYEFNVKWKNSQIIVNGIEFPFKLREKEKRVPDPVYSWSTGVPSGILVFRFGRFQERSYENSKKPLYEYLPNIFGTLEVLSKKEQESNEENRLRWIERERQENIRKAKEERVRVEKEKVDNLIKESEDWHKAELLRKFIKEAKRGELKSPEWCKWAWEVADSFDPFIKVH